MKKCFLSFLPVYLFIFCVFCPVFAEETGPVSGNIYLYGETHSDSSCLDKELEAWFSHYETGTRDLFVELPCYTAGYLNRWMHEETDDLLEMVFSDLENTAFDSPQLRHFYRQLKAVCPDTVFHGTDIGHQYLTTGARYLSMLESEGRKNSTEYLQAEAAIEQGRTYYAMQAEDPNAAFAYREQQMVDNFLHEYDVLDQKNVMGIYGSAHTRLFSPDQTGSVPCMATQLKMLLGNCISSADLTKPVIRSDTVTLNGKEYPASYYGRDDISWAEGYLTRDFWRVENAYEDLKDSPRTGNYLPAYNYIMEIRAGEVFIVEYAKTDGSLDRQYYLADGSTYSDWVLNTYQIIPDE